MLVWLIVGATALVVAWIVVMLVTPASIEAEVERELARIRRQMYRGWSDERIAEHHPDFCACQIHQLRFRTFSPVNRRTPSGR